MAALQKMVDKIHNVHGLVEKYATARNPQHAAQMSMPMKRAFSKLKLDLMGAGFDTMSQQAGAMEIAAGRGGSQRNKTRILREGVGSLRFQLEQEKRKLVTEEQREQQRVEREERRAEQERAEQEQRVEPRPPGQEQSRPETEDDEPDPV
ncbi:MAG: hypothetical protein ACN0LA_02675 [Candidatus Longimicrobiales bacterium M2_2A_002]